MSAVVGSKASRSAAATAAAPAAKPRSLTAFALGALGVVYGDIGTSPLYAFRQCLTADASGPANPQAVLGLLSLVFWSVTVIICVKYLTVLMRADNRGEGGILALLALVVPHGGGAADSGRRSSASGRASILPAPQPARTAIDRSSPSRTVLPTPRSPVSTRLRSGRPRATRSSTTSNALTSRSRPASSGGRWPAPGANGLRTGSTIGPYRGF